MTDINDTPPPAKTRRPLTPEHKAAMQAGKDRAKAALRAPPQRQIYQDEPLVEPPRATGVQAMGRDGEVLTRKRKSNTDAFYIPPSIIPQGWDYQWQAIEVTGQPQTATMITMAENGWRPVPAGRHEGMFMEKGYSPNGPIIRDGLRLEERPIELTQEARREEAKKAGQLVYDQQEQLGLTQKLPGGFTRENNQLRRMERSGTSREYAPAPDAPRPQLPIDPNG